MRHGFLWLKARTEPLWSLATCADPKQANGDNAVHPALSSNFCSIARQFTSNPCGPQGKHWEPRGEAPLTYRMEEIGA